MEITLLCRVIDNFGDIGTVWRLCRQLKSLEKDLTVNLIVDDLKSFNKIQNNVDSERDYQKIENIDIYKWQAEKFCHDIFIKNDGIKLSVIIECFQCGRPDWMEKILFEEKLQRTVNIIMIDYLTAEDYAEDFHCLKSLTRSSKVQKVNFMPGFTNKTGGLTIDKKWKNLPQRNSEGPCLVFTYPGNWKVLASVLSESKMKVLLARGRGFDSFLQAANEVGMKNLTQLDFMNMDQWDDLMQKCSLLFIRGEESMSRACLSGIPFVWQAYPQKEDYQIVKVKALLSKLKKYFDHDDYKIIERVWLDFNKNEKDRTFDDFSCDLREFIKRKNVLAKGFESFALDLRKNGDLASNLMTFIKKITIM